MKILTLWLIILLISCSRSEKIDSGDNIKLFTGDMTAQLYAFDHYIGKINGIIVDKYLGKDNCLQSIAFDCSPFPASDNPLFLHQYDKFCINIHSIDPQAGGGDVWNVGIVDDESIKYIKSKGAWSPLSFDIISKNVKWNKDNDILLKQYALLHNTLHDRYYLVELANEYAGMVIQINTWKFHSVSCKNNPNQSLKGRM